ncbi:arginine--tRNA ligase [Candidatus Woesearchaeota archaeon]|jgi:arginyl-tRNA synthetase|nr:arginine--tRNA ligase [Candidatus Woesearchaeota archaeon]MBT4835514.1 arginine--tRNA ligase [Candidatus Woesearchaeota archaeon]MBT6734800.1 arginine--tRNA ligase [Candidatus Woesearchaeota archaeon]MBT7169976.1 arginine--tRNA ligase [Candidatus Woesearchaeota archaeon]MBT7474488.1 arginine--tRNA ligase [Candidatus Woesearchaeota archaeon]
MDIKLMLSKILKKTTGEDVSNILEIPADPSRGDISLPCFFLSKKLKKSPVDIASEFVEKIKLPAMFSKVENEGPYLNFFLNKNLYSNKLIEEIFSLKGEYGGNSIGKSKNVVVEYSSPNIAKSFGIGHLRSTLVGNAIANIHKFNGYNVIRINYLGDWGTPFGKILFGYEKFGSKKSLKEDPVKHLFDLYVKMNKNEDYDEESKEYFKRLESGDKSLVKQWKLFRELSIKEFKEIYSLLGVKFDVYSGEAEYNSKLGGVIKELTKKKLLVEDDGANVVKLGDLGVALIQKSDGSSLYMTRDIATAIDRYKKYKFDKMIYEVGSEQKLHFRQLFEVLNLMGNKWSKDCVHIAHGMYLDEDGKKFSTRKGKTVFMKDVLNETVKLAEKSIKGRNVSKNAAMEIAKAAIIYGDLKNHPGRDAIFNIDKFLEFSGDTGPYLLYTYARANSIVSDFKVRKFSDVVLEENEFKLIKMMGEFPSIVKNSMENINPSVVSHYSYELCQSFNEFYHSCKVVGSPSEAFRINLVKSFMIVLENSLSLLGINVVKRM